MKMLKLVKNGTVLISEIEDASSFFRRFMGLMYRKEMAQDHGLLLTPCNEIHTFGMKFDIDTVALSQDGEVLFIDRAVPPHKVRKKVDGGYKMLEVNAGVCDKLGISVGDVLEFCE
ncbi:MAG: DUF192 domain-containing protein [Ruminococcaceae bacterium]|jgi:hypothetical protein|nr:DUF192 domain-containing protein [Oscillospiraceae bacterium]